MAKSSSFPQQLLPASLSRSPFSFSPFHLFSKRKGSRGKWHLHQRCLHFQWLWPPGDLQPIKLSETQQRLVKYVGPWATPGADWRPQGPLSCICCSNCVPGHCPSKIHANLPKEVSVTPRHPKTPSNCWQHCRNSSQQPLQMHCGLCRSAWGWLS